MFRQTAKYSITSIHNSTSKRVAYMMNELIPLLMSLKQIYILLSLCGHVARFLLSMIYIIIDRILYCLSITGSMVTYIQHLSGVYVEPSLI